MGLFLTFIVSQTSCSLQELLAHVINVNPVVESWDSVAFPYKVGE